MSENTVISLKDRIRTVIDTVDEVVEVPEWGLNVLVRSMSAAERYSILKAAQSVDDKLDIAILYPRIIIATAFDPEAGTKLFDLDDESWLMDKSPVALDRLASAGLRVSGLDEEAKDRGKDT
ncbi:MAG: hypothetical protein L0Z49_07635 [Actinobacteria bacterium]|nr:hypothetical protein [Actinomycetota bacterium]